MKLWLLSAGVVMCFLSGVAATCSTNPCTATDYRTYSSCLSNQCPNTVVATGCPESKCTSINCNTCSSSNACCASCCRQSNCQCSTVRCNTCPSSNACCGFCCPKPSQCECRNVNCDVCQGPCCSTCCPQQQDCCISSNRQECCVKNFSSPCCSTAQPIPVFTLPNITIFINQTPAIIYNTLNQSCGGVTTIRNITHTTTTTGTCPNTTTPRQPCCRILVQRPCVPYPFPPYQHCPPAVYNYACGPQCIAVPGQSSPPVIPNPPQVPIQLPVIVPQQQVYPQPTPGCYYQYNQCPSHCVGGCTYWPYSSGCIHVNYWPFFRCGFGNPYVSGAGTGGIGVFGGTGGIGGFGGPGGTGGFGGFGGFGGTGGITIG